MREYRALDITNKASALAGTGSVLTFKSYKFNGKTFKLHCTTNKTGCFAYWIEDSKGNWIENVHNLPDLCNLLMKVF